MSVVLRTLKPNLETRHTNLDRVHEAVEDGGDGDRQREAHRPTPETRSPEPETLIPNPETLIPNPESRIPKLETGNWKPETRNTNNLDRVHEAVEDGGDGDRQRKAHLPTPESRNPKPETLIPKPETRSGISVSGFGFRDYLDRVHEAVEDGGDGDRQREAQRSDDRLLSLRFAFNHLK